MIANTDNIIIILVHIAAAEHTKMVGVCVEKKGNNWLIKSMEFAVEVMPGGYICLYTALILNSFTTKLFCF